MKLIFIGERRAIVMDDVFKYYVGEAVCYLIFQRRKQKLWGWLDKDMLTVLESIMLRVREALHEHSTPDTYNIAGDSVFELGMQKDQEFLDSLLCRCPKTGKIITGKELRQQQ